MSVMLMLGEVQRLVFFSFGGGKRLSPEKCAQSLSLWYM